MTNEEATEAIRSVLSDAFDGRLIGDFLVVASVYEGDGDSKIAVHASDGMSLHSQLGLLTSALNRANAIDIDGWGCDE